MESLAVMGSRQAGPVFVQVADSRAVLLSFHRSRSVLISGSGYSLLCPVPTCVCGTILYPPLELVLYVHFNRATLVGGTRSAAAH